MRLTLNVINVAAEKRKQEQGNVNKFSVLEIKHDFIALKWLLTPRMYLLNVSKIHTYTSKTY